MNYLILSDKRAGHLNQSIAFAKHSQANYDIIHVAFTSKFAKILSYFFDFMRLYTNTLFKLDKPVNHSYDAIISAGSNTYYAAKTLAKTHGLKSITMMLPKGYRYDFDTIFAQAHDNPPSRNNIIALPANFSFTEPKGYFTPSKKAVGIIIGGNNSVLKMHTQTLKQQLDFIVKHFHDYDIALTTSPRTSQAIEELIKNYVFAYKVIFSQNPINPIGDFLHHCELVFITMDSTSMISEAISYGSACVEVLPLEEKHNNKFFTMIHKLEHDNFLHIFDGTIAHHNQKIDFRLFTPKAPV